MLHSISSETILTQDQIRDTLARAFDDAKLSGKRVLLIIPDGTRSGPIGMFFHLYCELLLGRVAAFDVLIALGTHRVMSEEQIAQHLQLTNDERTQLEGRVHIFNHEWWKPETFYTAGVLPAKNTRDITNGLIDQEIPVRLNRAILDYDQIIICGPVFPHEVAGFSGGHKYLFPGIAGGEIINFTHWLGALITSYSIIGTRDTPVRAIIERAAQFVTVPQIASCYIVKPPRSLGEGAGGEGHSAHISGLYVGEPYEAWCSAADQSAREHVTYLDKPVQRVVSVMPPMYADLWTAAKGMYKTEPIVADGGEVILYAPQLNEISYTHGAQLDEIGYHVRDYFVKQWDRFKDYPWAVLAHSTHGKGIGEYDAETGIESPRIQVTLATGISPERTARVNLNYLDPHSIDPASMQDANTLVIPKAGEQLYRLKRSD